MATRKFRPLQPDDVALVVELKKERARLRMQLPKIRQQLAELSDPKLAEKFDTTVHEVQSIPVDAI